LDIIDVNLDRVTKRFGDVVAVDDLTLEVDRGEFFSLLGPSGCGKTTTLRMIGGFEEPTEGAIYLRGNEVTDLPPYRRNVNTVFQSYALFPHLNVFENVAFGLRRKKTEKADMDRRVHDALRLVDLPGLEKRRPAQLSGGQQQRVALARALVNEPDVLLLDEPLGALDLKLRKQMQLELKRIQHEVGITFLYVTHDQEEAMTMSNRLAVMRHGRIEQIGRPREVYEKPATEFVAGFLGASNLLDGELKDLHGDTATVQLAGGSSITVRAERLNGLGRKFKVGVRPEKLVVLRPREEVPEGWNCVNGQIRDAAYVGVSHQFTVEGASGRTLNVYEQNIAGQSVPRPGESVRLVWKPVHTFVVRPSAPAEGEKEEGEWKKAEIA
jgi:spermidine/putrescine transport system ATP-binding protein